jgi:hypothetical protein
MGQANPRRAHKPAAPLRGRAVAIITSTLYSADPAFERGSFFGKKILVIVTSIFFSEYYSADSSATSSFGWFLRSFSALRIVFVF